MMKASAQMIQNIWFSPGPAASDMVNSAVSAMIAPSVPRLMTWRAGSMIGAPDILPFSLAKAMTDPEKVIAPMAAPSAISTRLTLRILPSAPRIPKASGLRKAATPTSTAARPTRL